jgi:UDP-N-acetylmuramoylalanine-D-glutamate ligase
MAGPVVVLAGGQTKRGNATGWLTELKSKACAVVLFGAGAEELGRTDPSVQLSRTGASLHRSERCRSDGRSGNIRASSVQPAAITSLRQF